MNREALVNILLAIMPLVDAALCILQESDEEETGECQHPLESRKNYSTMGVERWQCGVCGYFHEEVNHGTDNS